MSVELLYSLFNQTTWIPKWANWINWSGDLSGAKWKTHMVWPMGEKNYHLYYRFSIILDTLHWCSLLYWIPSTYFTLLVLENNSQTGLDQMVRAWPPDIDEQERKDIPIPMEVLLWQRQQTILTQLNPSLALQSQGLAEMWHSVTSVTLAAQQLDTWTCRSLNCTKQDVIWQPDSHHVWVSTRERLPSA